MQEIEIKKLPESEIEITGEISAGDFEVCRKKAIEELSEGVKIDGFRPGNAPEKILIDKIGDGAILERMAEIALRKAYPKILEERKIPAIGRPQINITKIAKGNPLGFKIKTAVIPEIDLQDYKEIAKKINEKTPTLRQNSSEVGAPTPKGVGEEKTKARQKKYMEILEKIIESSKMEVPKILIEAEKNKILHETKANISQMGLKWEDYLKHLKKTEEEILAGWKKDGLKRVQISLILDKIAEAEKVEVDKDELEKETEKIMEHYKKAGQSVDISRVKAYTYGILRNEKVFKLLESC